MNAGRKVIFVCIVEIIDVEGLVRIFVSQGKTFFLSGLQGHGSVLGEFPDDAAKIRRQAPELTV
jgi:hypothetical protein